MKTNEKQVLDNLNKNAKNGLKKQAGFSLPSVIVGSIIAAILGGMALTSMWGSVDKATISAEGSSIAEAKTAAAGLLEDVGSFPSKLGATADANAKARVAQLPKELNYEFALVDYDGTAGGNDQAIVLKAYATDEAGVARLKAVVDSLDKQYDGTAGKATGKFVYNDTCSTPDGTDCFYVTTLLNKSVSNPLSLTAGSETKLGDVTTTINSDLTAAAAADYESPLN